MTLRHRFSFVVLFGLVAAAAHPAAQQKLDPAQAARTAPLTQQLPIDPLVTSGQLENGVRYFIRRNARPEKRAELRLAVNVGSIHEEDDQRGLAHFVEHMAFNGTKNFPKQEIVAFMESIGMRFGPSVNAFTGFDETVYMLQVPTDRPAAMKKSFQILEDWAHNVTFDPVEIDKERGVIVEEWRLRRGASARMQDQQFPVLLQGSRYADRLPIGSMDVVQKFPHERLTQFYADWYRPELMAVIAVGDFEPVEIEALIEQHFGAIPASKTPKVRPSYGVPDHAETLFAIATDKEALGTSVSIYAKMEARDQATVGGYRRQIVERLFSSMLSARYSELAQKPDPPFIGAGTSRGQFVREKEATTLSANVKEDGIERGLEALFVEAERVARHGFTMTELDRTRLNMQRGIERALAEQHTQLSSSYATEYANHFFQQEPIPGIVYEHALYERFLPEITLDEVNALATGWLPPANRVVVVSAPEKPGVSIPDEPRLASVIASAAKREIAPYVDAADEEPLLADAPKPGSIARTTEIDYAGVTEWRLSNGITVVLKPTTFKEDEIVVRAMSDGGTSLASDDDYIAATTAAQVIANGGLGRFSAVDLGKKLSGKVASVRPFIGAIDHGITGSASRTDLETLFQLIYMTFTQPRADEQVFEIVTTRLRSLLPNQMNVPEVVFADAVQTILSQGHPRARTMTAEMVDEMDLQKSLAFYRERFANASGFTFVFAGTFDLEEMKPLVEQYLGGLPSSGTRETWKDIGMKPPSGVIEKRVEKGIEPKSRAAIIFHGPFEWTQEERIAIRVMSDVLQNRLRETLREELGGTYSVSAGAGYSRVPRSEYTMSIDFGSDPDRNDELVKAVFSEIETLKTTGPTERQVNDVREAMLRDHETNIRQNAYLLAQIAARYQAGESLQSLFVLPEYYNKVTPATVQSAAKRYLDTANYVKATLFPEKKPE
ncbi:MAG: insulinase family protein [Acidobacteria bacterium]|nr:insulinase family protein [Acidobacteriota bacterium]